MNNVTYYLGAGASANALPLYSNFKIRLEVFKDFITHFVNKEDKDMVAKADLYLNSLDELILDLSDSETSTLDALANELYLRKTTGTLLNFNKLKYLVSDFFVFEQLRKSFSSYRTQYKDVESLTGYVHYDNNITNQVNTHVDKRYRSFITSELQGEKFPREINFISWNYDIQLELGYRRVRGYSLDSAQEDLQVFPSPNCIKGIDINESSVIKLNGTAGIYYSDNKSIKLENFVGGDGSFQESYIWYMLDVFNSNSSRIFGGYPFFTFSFEKERKEFTEKAINYAIEIMRKTSTLVVIGYSFHPLNRSVDLRVFEEIPRLNNIIVQVPSETEFGKIKYNIEKILRKSVLITHNPYINDFIASNNV